MSSSPTRHISRASRATSPTAPGLAGRRVPFHRRAETRVEIGLAGCEHAELERAAAFPAIDDRHRLALEIFGQAPAVLVAAAVHDDDAVGRRHARLDRLGRTVPVT